jgi:signal transduction histidine kinase
MIGGQASGCSATEVFLESALGKSIAGVLSADDRDEVHSFEYIAEDQHVHEIRINPLPAGGGVTVCIDITERKNNEIRLRTAKEQAEVAARAKTTFLATVSHELRTPLNAIIGFSDLMVAEAAGPLGGEYLEYSRDINSSGKHLLSLINDLLDISKIEAGKYDLKETHVEVGWLMNNCARMVRDLVSTAGLSLEMDVPPELPCLFADERLVKQTLLNLLSNAIKFTNPGGVVRVGVMAPADGAGGFTFFVQDTGIGIAADDIPKAFAPFGQIDTELSRKYNGTGLGLPLVKAVTELHDGAVVLESEPGKGTRVTVTFPKDRVRPLGQAIERAVA